MGYVFISYSHSNKDYVRKLSTALKNAGVEVWIDEHIDYGTKWPKIIQDKLDGCSAFVLVMTSQSFESDWVQNELSRAMAKRKPIFPLLLEGDVWLTVQAVQYVDVRGEALPPSSFYERLGGVVRKKLSVSVPEASKVIGEWKPFYEYRHSLKEFTDAISGRWQEGYDLGAIAYGNGAWFGVFLRKTPITGYEYRSSLKEFTDAIAKRWKEGYDLGSVAYGDGVWFGTFPKKTPITGYGYRSNLKEFTETIEQRWKDGYDLGCVAYGDGIWFGTFPKKTPITGYEYRSGLKEFTEAIEKRRQNGYSLGSVAYGDGIWFGAFSNSR